MQIRSFVKDIRNIFFFTDPIFVTQTALCSYEIVVVVVKRYLHVLCVNNFHFHQITPQTYALIKINVEDTISSCTACVKKKSKVFVQPTI